MLYTFEITYTARQTDAPSGPPIRKTQRIKGLNALDAQLLLNKQLFKNKLRVHALLDCLLIPQKSYELRSA